MKMNIYKHEFKMNLKSVITWSVAVAALLFIFISLFASFSEEAELLNEMMAEFPEELLMAFGMDGMDFFSPLGFFSLAFLFTHFFLGDVYYVVSNMEPAWIQY